ncbi:MAG TPA: PilZ domain-containing protein [Vicinamibacteria bacterium]|jgi:Tfp pilus assembly protein PilZ|nr:PilZ domain-containing protein [Vicinamibacteria bacterium]
MTHQPYSAMWRVPLQAGCRLEGGGSAAAGALCNLSLGGAYVAVNPVPRVGENVLLSFALPGKAGPIAVEAVVCWDNSGRQAPGLPSGCGLEFLAPAWADRSRIEAAVRASTGSDWQIAEAGSTLQD